MLSYFIFAYMFFGVTAGLILILFDAYQEYRDNDYNIGRFLYFAVITYVATFVIVLWGSTIASILFNVDV